ncbi:MAG: hypothetical protein COA84_11340 [Robiginitomaculum sp.]|nr:MAG: hypothetical protein COA84_11340 [Robiginitomaculum sp.]
MNLVKMTLVTLVLAVLTSCTNPTQTVTPFMDNNPQDLSAWGIVAVQGGTLALGQDVMPYDLNTPLFTDAAHKLRAVWVPPDKTATYREDRALDFPVGTVIAKTFYYPKDSTGTLLRNHDYSADFAGEGLDLAHVRLVETRILVHREKGWVALPYIWNAAQSDAVLERVGGAMALSLLMDDGQTQDFTYVVPNANQCAGCHAPNATTRAIEPIGPAARHLNKTYTYHDGEENQLDRLVRLGKLSGLKSADTAPKNANWRDETAPLDKRARAYLDINCGHCHNPHGAADTSAFYLDRPEHQYPAGNTGICKPPVAAGQGTGGHSFDIVPGDAEDSILVYRMASTNPGVMMPELGRSTIDEAGVALIAEWINAMDGDCRPAQ